MLGASDLCCPFPLSSQIYGAPPPSPPSPPRPGGGGGGSTQGWKVFLNMLFPSISLLAGAPPRPIPNCPLVPCMRK
eukprot:jgi/Botrbrau1/23006/Bobra.0564s0001.1